MRWRASFDGNVVPPHVQHGRVRADIKWKVSRKRNKGRMTNDANPRLHLRFALVSLAVTFILATGFVLVARELVRSSNEGAAAEASRSLVAQPLATALFAGGETATDDLVRLRAENLVPTLVSGDVRGVRIWAGDGTRLYSTGDENDAGSLRDGGSVRASVNGGGSILAT